ncbi:hypothetical protein M770_13455 [Pseudomonas aeruginosa VRFPA03]|nr:hypothetical protein M770_13455 [Pseudomonas aeruginosa VRFPA03]
MADPRFKEWLQEQWRILRQHGLIAERGSR